MRKLILGTVVVLFLISGCGTFSQAYRHKETGQVTYCTAFGFALGYILAYALYTDCKAAKEKAGHVPIEEGEVLMLK